MLRYTPVALLLAGAALAGCESTRKVRPVPVAPPRETPYEERTPREKPLPPQGVVPQPGFEDPALLVDAPPETRAYVEAYQRVGKPKILVFVNRNLDGQLIQPANPPVFSAQVVQTTTTQPGVVETRRTENVDVYLKPSQVDPTAAQAVDYELVESTITDWLSANGQVLTQAPLLARKRLSPERVAQLQAGQPGSLRDLARDLDADILIHVQAWPTAQSSQGLSLRIIAEAINTADGLSIARASVDMDPPLEKTRVNKYTRFLSRKLMDGMSRTWASHGAPAAPKPQP